MVTLKDPVGFAVSFIHGQKLPLELPHTTQDQEINFPDRKPRLGEYGLIVPPAKFAEVVAFSQDFD